jgi:hypothetical protein
LPFIPKRLVYGEEFYILLNTLSEYPISEVEKANVRTEIKDVYDLGKYKSLKR